jgi:crotonobetainyl-CoA:carnitine CoA-transferase CaiB-like acyl-CoA transferase
MTALAALRARRLTGEGQHAWISVAEIVGVVMGGAGLAAYVFNGEARPRSGFHNPGFYPWQVVPARDGFFEIITMVDEQWDRFVELMGSPDWASDERLQNRWLTFQWAEEIDAYWHPWLAERSKAELTRTFAELRLPFQPVQTIDEVVAAEHLEAREFWVDAEHPVAGRFRTLGGPYKLSAAPWSIERPAPLLGEHNEEVEAEWQAEAAPEPRSRAARPSADNGAASAPALPMEGLRVLDHGHVWAGPLLAQMLADLGAEVIKIRAPNRMSGVAMAGRAQVGLAPDAADDDPRAYHGWDRGKLGISIDLTTPEGLEIYLRLVRESDVIVENFSPRVMPGLGLSYEVLAEANPRIVMASLSATGATDGPWRDLLTYGPSLSALYGAKSLQGYVGDPRPREDTADLDPTAAAHGFVAVCAALEYRERTGRGQHIDLAQGEATMQRIAEPIFDYLFNGRVASTQGNRYPGAAPHGAYPAAGEDAWIAVAVHDDEAWAALLRVAADEPRLGEGRFATLKGRLARQDELDEVVADWTRRLDATEAAERLQAAGVSAYPVMNPPNLLVDENFTALRTSHVRMETAAGFAADEIYQTVPWKLPATPGIVRLPTPGLGEHNAEVYGRLLGLDDQDLDGLSERGVI